MPALAVLCGCPVLMCQHTWTAGALTAPQLDLEQSIAACTACRQIPAVGSKCHAPMVAVESCRLPGSELAGSDLACLVCAAAWLVTLASTHW